MKIAVFHNLPSGGAKRTLYGFCKFLRDHGNNIDAFLPSTANELFLPLKESRIMLQSLTLRTIDLGKCSPILNFG